MKSLTLPLAALALTLSVAATAQHSRTTTHEGPRGSATQTVTRADGVRQSDTVVTRSSDGATATGSRTRTRSDTGSSLSVDQTGFAGRSRSLDAERVRTEDGSTVTGTATGRGGENYIFSGQRQRTDTGATSSQRVNDSSGQTVYSRDASRSRVDGQVSRSVQTSRAEGFRRPARATRARRP